MGSLSHEGGRAKSLGPPRDAGMFAWIRDTQTEAELWAFKCRQCILEGRFMGFCAAPGLRGSFWLIAQKDILTVRNTPGWKVVVRGGGEFSVL